MQDEAPQIYHTCGNASHNLHQVKICALHLEYIDGFPSIRLGMHEMWQQGRTVHQLQSGRYSPPFNQLPPLPASAKRRSPQRGMEPNLWSIRIATPVGRGGLVRRHKLPCWCRQLWRMRFNDGARYVGGAYPERSTNNGAGKRAYWPRVRRGRNKFRTNFQIHEYWSQCFLKLCEAYS